jgi:hypothetical protein
MKISEQQTLPFGEESSTSLQAVGHASQFLQQGNEEGKMMFATCGRKTLEQFGKFSRVSSWAKMFADSLIGKGEFYSTKCKLTWKLKATKCSRFYFQLQVSTLPTDEIESVLLPTITTETGRKSDFSQGGKSMFTRLKEVGLLPTPDASLATGGKVSNQETVTITGKMANGKKRQITLNDYAKRGLLPTPTAASDAKGGCTRKDPQRQQDTLAHAIHGIVGQTGKTSQLNPLFVTEMMGFPSDWLTLPFLENTEPEPSQESKYMDDGEKKA